MDQRSKLRDEVVLNVLLWVAVVAAAVVFAMAGGAKVSGASIGQFEEWGYTPAFAVGIGFIEIVGAIGLLIPRACGWAALGLIVVMFGALGTHVSEAEYGAAMVPMLMIVLLSFVLFGRGLGRMIPPTAAV
jgi:putative oxidoreductase